MKREQLSDEIRKAIKWTGTLCRFITIRAFRIFLRLIFVGISLFLVGGGCFALQSYFAGKREADAQVPALNRQSLETGQRGIKEFSTPQENNESLESRIRSGRSQVESWRYTLRSVKRDIEGWFKR